ncbi:MAG TPA: hypothetical protein DDW98_02440 [Gammaproteobacteria bacterium]|jgi:osmotically-inducible protein OsmY|uniref:Osmotically-inducible protein Y n=2 Tax=Candidatus Macondimonas diazotrophica TaxID=2305248 RepID=A0A4Z0FDJ8_9GAMM|nr:BON domain-containing protein [Candidatus Macondimonas diazotrophica]HBG29480.1 hypothetical protein [Gammaproteobacteria bacterium]HBG50291.1 hypothetical protein [Gammaproteobacteria bacterium]
MKILCHLNVKFGESEMQKQSKARSFMQATTLMVGLAACSSFVMVPAAMAAERSATERVDDAAITAQVKTRLLANEVTRSININVDTKAGVVTLRGTAPNETAKEKAEEVAHGVEGVQAVANALIIGDSSMNPQTATAKAKDAAVEGEQMAGDAWITTKVKAQLLADDEVKGFDINVSTKSGVVTLAGLLPSEAMRDKAVRITKGVKGVKKVNSDALKVGS